MATSRRTTCVARLPGILHDARSADGGHLFDLLDIQKGLDHADPATTQLSYLDPMDTGMKERASVVLD